MPLASRAAVAMLFDASLFDANAVGVAAANRNRPKPASTLQTLDTAA